MSKTMYEHHAPRDFKNKSKSQPDDIAEGRSEKVSFKSYLRQVREEEATAEDDHLVYKPGEITEFTDEHETQIVNDFVEWSGGYYPNEMTDSDLQDFAIAGSDSRFDSDAVLRFVRNYVKED